MQTTLDCLPCFMKQALFTGRIATDSPYVRKKIMDAAARLLPEFDMALSPPENAIGLYSLIARLSGTDDPFKEIKEKSTQMALGLRDEIKRETESSPDPLATALKYAIAGNIIDYGAPHRFNIKKTIENCLAQEFKINHIDRFREDLEKAESILYLADNCGEIVFDSILIEQLEKPVTFVVKESPIINDALFQDAVDSGLDRLCTVITNGTNCPGTPLDSCSPIFKKTFRTADIIISKGQGNFETLSEIKGPIYSLLTVKCQVVARHITEFLPDPEDKVAPGDMILMRNHNFCK